MKTKMTYKDVILATMPFADELLDWCQVHPEFKDALKISHPERFIHIGSVMISHPKSHPNDEIIGVYAYDYGLKSPKFKQDFIVNHDKAYKEFTLYTKNPAGYSDWVKPIGEFFKTYDIEKIYVKEHHLEFNQLPANKLIRHFAQRAIKLGEGFRKDGFQKPSKSEIQRIYKEVVAEREKLKE